MRLPFHKLRGFNRLILLPSGILPNLLRGLCTSRTVRDCRADRTGTILVLGACYTEVQLHFVLGQYPEVPCREPFVSGVTPS